MCGLARRSDERTPAPAPRRPRRPPAHDPRAGAQRLRRGADRRHDRRARGRGGRRRHPRAGAGSRGRLVLRRRRPQLDARHGRRQRSREPRGLARPRPPDAHAGRTAEADHRPRAGCGVRRRGGPGGLLRHRDRRAGGEVRPDRKQAGPAAGGDLAVRDQRDRAAPRTPVFRQRGDLRCRRSAAHRPAAPGGARGRTGCRRSPAACAVAEGRADRQRQRQVAGARRLRACRRRPPRRRQRRPDRPPARVSPEGQEGLSAFLDKRKPHWIDA